MDFRKSVHFEMESEKLINSRPLILSQFVRIDNLKTLDKSFRESKIEECIQFIERLKSLCDNSSLISEVLPLCKRIEDLYRDEYGELYPQLLNANEDFIKKAFYVENPLDLNDKQLNNLKKHYNKDYFNAIQVFQTLNILLINGIRQVNFQFASSVEKLKKSESISQGDQNLPIVDEETDSSIEDNALNRKIHLLNCIGFLEPLSKHYFEHNPEKDRDDFSRLLAEILGKSAKIGSFTKSVSAGLKKEVIGSPSLNDYLTKTLADHNLPDKNPFRIEETLGARKG